MTKKDDECVELKNIKYQTMLMNKTKQNETPKKHTTNIEQFLNRESMQNTKKPWNKLEKSIKEMLACRININHDCRFYT